MSTIGQQLAGHVRRKVEAAIIIAGELVATEARRSVNKAPRGGTYQLRQNSNGSFRTVKASAPYESPATDLGFLVRSIQTEPDMDNLRIRILSLHSIAPYAKALEFGDMSRGLYPRPFMYKALNVKTAQATAIVQNALKQAVREMNGARS